MNRKTLVAALAAMLSGCLPTPPNPSPSPTPTPTFTLPFYQNSQTRLSVQTSFFDPNSNVTGALSGLGFKDFRGGYYPAVLRQANGSFNWVRSDKWWASLPKGIQPLILLGPEQAMTDADFAVFMGEFAGRYNGCLYEGVNEPDLPQNWQTNFSTYQPTWTQEQALDAYAAQSLACIKAIRAKDVSAAFISGGTSGVKPSWVQGCVDRHLYDVGAFDACGVHPYGQTPASIAQAYNVLVQMLPKDVELWTTEYGDPNLSLLQTMYDAHVKMGIAYFTWYRLEDQPNAQDISKTCGLLTSTYQPKPVDATVKSINLALA
jgi:hypothetical protein